ncbi:uncharacterized protein At4g15970-like [Camellia sinensis]|uniref:uncharacterized protein At4g15970-like n=1 Tax=Camellia sinensis TaxID=4442 RepID=UPI001036B1B3|nr:uncharacterized protein At4g15970-like [Camellia sinensis]
MAEGGLSMCYVVGELAAGFSAWSAKLCSGLLHVAGFEDKEGEVRLKGILEKAAMADKTVIITTVNGAWTEPGSVFDLFLESFRIGNQTRRLLNHLVVIALDQKAYDRCSALHLHCYVLSTHGKDFSGVVYFMSTGYVDMMWRRIDLLHSVLKLGYNFIFTDADVLWFRDPFLHFYLDGDFQISCDFFRSNPSDINNQPNGGFNYVKSNKHTIKFYQFWYTSRETYPGLHDQDVLDKIKFDPLFSIIGVKMRFLDTAYFGGFCQPSKDLNHVCTMHANCCIGLDHKVHDLKVMLEDWRKFLSLPTNVKALQSTSWTIPQKCSLHNLQFYHLDEEDKM